MPTRASRRRAVAVAACTLGLMLGSAACSQDETKPPTAAQGNDGDRASLTTYASVGEMADALTAGGLSCTLEYEGLTDAGKELSLCALDGEQATLSIWFEPGQLDQFLLADVGGVGVTAVGGNWTVDVSTDTLAQQVADILGGTVKV